MIKQYLTQAKVWITDKDNRSTLLAWIVSSIIAIVLIYLMFSIHY